MKEKVPVLMTASVSTRGMKDAYYAAEEREMMYIETLNYYIETVMSDPNQHIVFAENSGWNLEHLKAQLNHFDPERLTFISLDPDLFDISKGKGYNELLMMNLAIEESEIITRSGGFVKVTGRYPIYNLPYYIKEASDAFENGKVLYCDVKDHNIYDFLRLGWTGHSFYSVLYGVKNEYYFHNIGPKYKELNDYDNRLVEGMLYQLIVDESKSGRNWWRGEIGDRIIARFKREPVCGGLQGSRMAAWSFSADQNNLKSKIKRGIGNGFRIILPWIWF